MLALMSAGDNPQKHQPDGVYTFQQKLPVAPYLIALTCGDIVFTPVGERTGVYSEPDLASACKYEFQDMEKLLQSAEKLFGPYGWGRYDMIILPPGFPYGGMENPNLTFATPTIIAGDKSLVSLVAHELAHSWAGNRVTNATWNDIWLNEGITVYLERRISEDVFGKEYADMNAVNGYQDLQKTLKEFGDNNPDAALKLQLKDRDPDESLSDVSYEKGYLLILNLEKVIGRPKMDSLLSKWFATYTGKSVVTEDFIQFVENFDCGVPADSLRFIRTWIYTPGIPSGAVVSNAEKFNVISTWVQEQSQKGFMALPPSTQWSAWEWVHFIRQLPANTPHTYLKKIDDTFHLSRSSNSEIRGAWLNYIIAVSYQPGDKKALSDFCINVGRRKFLTPLYEGLVKTGRQSEAKEIYLKARNNYHALTRKTVEEILNGK
jgi:aminopeptidase N